MPTKTSNRVRRFAAAAAIALFSVSGLQAKTPKYVFYFIGDGMGIAEATNAQLYNKEVLGSDKPLLMTTFPVVSMITTHSASSDVTDSAAAGTALATGNKTRNGMLGMDADTVAVTSVARHLKDAGWGVGLVTSVGIDDATPAAFYTHVPNRGDFYDIDRSLAESGYDFLAGAGMRGTKGKDGKPNDIWDLLKANNVSVAIGMEQLDPKAKKVLLLSPFHEEMNNEIGYTVDSLAGGLRLPEMTRAGISHLKRVSPDRFFMMVEGGNIDHAGHGNDGGTSVREVLNFNEALQEAYNFYLEHPDETLILVTADHETGGMSVGCRTTGYSAHPEVARAQKISKDKFSELTRSMINSGDTYTWEYMQTLLADKFGFGTAVKLSDNEQKELRELFDKTFVEHKAGDDLKTLYSSSNRFVERVFSLLNGKSGFGWTTNDHTGHPVPLYVVGAGAGHFSNFNDNTDLPKKILKIVKGEKF